MLTLRNRLASAYRVGGKYFHPSLTAARLTHTGRSPYTERSTSSNITQPLSFSAVRHEDLVSKRPQEEKPRDVCTYAHNFSIDSEEDEINPMDIQGEIMRSIAAKIGIPYLSKVSMAESKQVVKKCAGYIYGTKKRTIVPFPVSYGQEARWIYFLILSGFQSTYLSPEASEALCLEKEGESVVRIGGRSSAVLRSPRGSPLGHLNILGTDFCYTNDVIKVENYVNHRVQLFFSTLDTQDAVFEFCDERVGE